jgi:hypothetical protein
MQACIPQNKAIMQTHAHIMQMYAHIEIFVKLMCDVYRSCSQLPYKYILWYVIAHVTVYCIRLQLQLQCVNKVQYLVFCSIGKSTQGQCDHV